MTNTPNGLAAPAGDGTSGSGSSGDSVWAVGQQAPITSLLCSTSRSRSFGQRRTTDPATMAVCFLTRGPRRRTSRTSQRPWPPPAAGRIDPDVDRGRAWTPTELATHHGWPRSSTTEHLNVLLGCGIIGEARQGKHRYVRLSGAEVAENVERLAALAPTSRPADHSLKGQNRTQRLRVARTCYTHLAGQRGVQLRDGLVRIGVVTTSVGYSLSPDGHGWFEELGYCRQECRRLHVGQPEPVQLLAGPGVHHRLTGTQCSTHGDVCSHADVTVLCEPERSERIAVRTI